MTPVRGAYRAVVPSCQGRIGGERPGAAGVTEAHLPGPKTAGFWPGRSRLLTRPWDLDSRPGRSSRCSYTLERHFGCNLRADSRVLVATRRTIDLLATPDLLAVALMLRSSRRDLDSRPGRCFPSVRLFPRSHLSLLVGAHGLPSVSLSCCPWRSRTVSLRCWIPSVAVKLRCPASGVRAGGGHGVAWVGRRRRESLSVRFFPFREVTPTRPILSSKRPKPGPGALPLDFGGGCGPGARPRHRPPQQLRQPHACCCRFGSPLG